MRDRQQKILSYIRDFIERHDYPPSIRQIQQDCQISSTSVVDYNLKALEKQGFIRRDKDVSRGIELLEPGGARARVVRVPVLGTIAAGAPIEVPGDRDPEDFVDVAPDVVRGRDNVFALRVKGDSMIDDGIFDGDTVILQAAQTADDGETVAAWLLNEEATTLKRFHREGDRIRLQPRNPKLAPIYADARDVQIQAKLISRMGPS